MYSRIPGPAEYTQANSASLLFLLGGRKGGGAVAVFVFTCKRPGLLLCPEGLCGGVFSLHFASLCVNRLRLQQNDYWDNCCLI